MKLVTRAGYFEAVPESLSEIKVMSEFPGMIHRNSKFVAPLKPLVVQSLSKRIKALFKKPLDVDRTLFDLATSKLKLLPIPEEFSFHTSPKKAQEVGIRFLITNDGGGLLLEPGMGKTKIYLDFIFLKKFRRSLVICPKALLGTWEEEAEIHRPELKVYVVKSTKWQDELPKMREADLVVINYDKAVTLAEGLSSEIHFDSMNIDEGLIKNPSTARTGALTRIGQSVKHRILSSGTLINNSPLDLFAPVRYLEPSLVGSSYSKFKSVYAIEKKTKSGPDGRETKFVVGYRNVAELRDILESCSIVMTKEEWLDLPPKTFKVVRCITSDSQKRVFSDLQSKYSAEFQGRTVEVASPLVLAAKQCQVANGFLYYSEGADLLGEELDFFGEEQFSGKRTKKKKSPREILYFDEQPKLHKLIELLTKDLGSRRVIVWYNLHAEKVLIEEAFARNAIEFLTIAGGEKDTSAKVRTFNRVKKYQVLLCQAKAVNYGVTVLGHKEDSEVDEGTVFGNLDSQVYTSIFYSLNFSLEVFLQQQDRIHRIGQDMDCEYYILLSDFDVESYIYEVLGSKKSVKESMMVDFVKARKLLE